MGDERAGDGGVEPDHSPGWFSRPPYRRLLLTSLVALVPALVLFALNRAPVAPGCFEYCEVGQDLAGIGLVLVGELWLVAVLSTAWTWRYREPAVAALAAVAAAPCLALVTLRLFGVIAYGAVDGPLLMLAWVFGIGLQLPGVWRLAFRAPPSMPLRAIVAIMNLVVFGAALATLLFGTDEIWSAGPRMALLAWALFTACLIPITAAAWLDHTAAPGRVGPLLAASLLILVFPVAFAMPGAIGYVVFLAIPLTALAWLWIAIGWIRAEPRAPA